MFREVYKQANDEIKGDTLIIEKAFQQASASKKKAPVLGYSFVGTCVAAMLVFGVLFMNSNLFTEKKFAEEVPTEEASEVKHNEGAMLMMAKTIEREDAAIEADETKKNAVNEESVNTVTNTSDEAIEEVDDAPMLFSIRPQEIEDEVEAVGESEDGGANKGGGGGSKSAVEVFSYMYDLGEYEADANKAGFKNTIVNPIKTGEDAIERAKKEIEYENHKINVYHDAVEGIWKVTFVGENEDDIMIYLNSDGITVMTVGEK